MSATAVRTLTDLARVLVRVGRECDAPVEHLRAEQLLREASEAWPGEGAEQWRRWMAEACRCLNLRSQEADLGLDRARGLSQDGAAVVGLWRPESGPLLLVSDREVAEGELDARREVSIDDLRRAAQESPDPDRWLIVERGERCDAVQSPRLADRPVLRLVQILAPERADIGLILVFAFFAGLLNLSTPIAVEALVNTVAFGRLLQPVVVLAALLFGFLAFAGAMHAMQTYVAEIIQRRLFARVSADLAHRLPAVDASRLEGAYAPELANRFLDVVTLQKVASQLLLDGVNIVLATLVGMAVLAFYHPWLLGFDVLLMGLVIGGLVVLGRGAIRTGINESKYKYRLTAWFQDVTRCATAFKPAGGAEFAADRANEVTSGYLSYRRTHFGVVFRQVMFVLGLQAIAGTVLLGAGGWLVIQGQLTLGQLVAAELIVSVILASMAKIGKHLEGFYDLVAAVDKLGVLFDLPLERSDGLLTLDAERGGLAVSCWGLRIDNARGAAGEGLTFDVPSGERVALVGPSRTGKSAICRALYGALRPAAGRIAVGGVAPSEARPEILRSRVALAAEPDVFEGTLAENVHLRRRGVGARECLAALEAVGMLDACTELPGGIDTPLSPSAWPLSGTQQRLLMLARAITASPQLLLIDGTLDALPDDELTVAVDALLAPEREWTVIVATGRRDIAERMPRAIELTPRRDPRSAGSLNGRGDA